MLNTLCYGLSVCQHSEGYNSSVYEEDGTTVVPAARVSNC